jgi:hypothetical protein
MSTITTPQKTVSAANREYKDTVFKLLFCQKEVAIDTCNAIFGTHYGPDTNVDVVRRCEALYGYTTFVNKAREYNKIQKMSSEDAIRKAVLYCIDNNILKNFFNQNKKEIINMFTEEWSLDVAVKVAEEDGMLKGKVEIAKAMRAKGMDVNAIAELTKLTVDDILRM